MADRNIGKEILDGIREIKAHKAGKVKLRTHKLKEPSSVEEVHRLPRRLGDNTPHH